MEGSVVTLEGNRPLLATEATRTHRNIDAWYDAFGVKPGDKYYLSPDKRVHLW